jgi:hypothetical protein
MTNDKGPMPPTLLSQYSGGGLFPKERMQRPKTKTSPKQKNIQKSEKFVDKYKWIIYNRTHPAQAVAQISFQNPE